MASTKKDTPLICKKCNTKMNKVYSFPDGTPYQQLVCPQCGASTIKRTIEYDEKDGTLKRKGGSVLND